MILAWPTFRNTVKPRGIDIGLELVSSTAADRRSPELDRDLISTVDPCWSIQKALPTFVRVSMERKYIAAGAVIIAWDCPQRFALLPLPLPARKEDKGIVFMSKVCLYRKSTPATTNNLKARTESVFKPG